MSGVLDKRHSIQQLGETVLNQRGYIVFGDGDTVPTDGAAGYEVGCIWIDTNAADGSAILVNEGTAASADFNPITGGQALSGLTSTPTELNTLAAANAILATEGGPGIVGDAETYATSVQKLGGIIITRILIDLTGLDSSGTADDVIGDLAGGAAYIGRITAARNGTIVGGTMRCLEIPTGGDPDVDLWSAPAATAIFDDLITDLTGEAQLINTGDWTLEEDTLTAFPAADDYLYLAAGATDDATYTAGKFLITLYGIPA